MRAGCDRVKESARPVRDAHPARVSLRPRLSNSKCSWQNPPMPDNLLGRIGDFLHGRRPWYELPRLLSLPMLVEIRNQLRRENLLDTEEPPLEQKSPADLDPATRNERTVDGSNNDLKFPAMGSCGRRFGRNVPLEHTFPDTANLMTPNPRVVSRELMTREAFQPATILNLLAAAWIQFMVHDWFVHKRSPIEDGSRYRLRPATTGQTAA